MGMLRRVGYELGDQQGDADSAIRRDRNGTIRLVLDLTLRRKPREVLADVGKVGGKVNGADVGGAVKALVDASHGCHPAHGFLEALGKLGICVAAAYRLNMLATSCKLFLTR